MNTPRLLVVRRDNIGDLVCTTPLLAALRQRFPDAWIGVLANSYNAPVLAGNPDIDELFTYTKLKHRAPGQGRLEVLGKRAAMLWRLRRMGLDDVILATPAPQPRLVSMARWLKPKRLIGFGEFSKRNEDVALALDQADGHEVEQVFRIARLYGIEGPPPGCRVVAPPGIVKDATRVAIHISARKPSQRWPAERFAELMRALRTAEPQLRFTLLWAPGPADDPQHPGDDDKAAAVLAALGPGFPIVPEPTASLSDLIAALAPCSAMICADGGAMHVAAGLGLPVVCLFGNSDTTRWRPWGVPYRLLQKPSLQLSDVEVAEVAAAFSGLRAQYEVPTAARR